MPLLKSYLFTSARLGFRTWQKNDVHVMAAINADPAVMEFFPATQSISDTENFIARMQEQFARNGFCYYAVDRLDTGGLIGFTGMCEKDFQSEFTPCTDIGWRFSQQEWYKGFATEAAIRCLRFGFAVLGMERIVSMAPIVNTRSIAVMKKSGMTFERTFKHPLLLNDDRLRTCALYQITQQTTTIR